MSFHCHLWKSIAARLDSEKEARFLLRGVSTSMDKTDKKATGGLEMWLFARLCLLHAKACIRTSAASPLRAVANG